MPDNRVAPSSPPKGKGARRHEAFEPLRQGHESKPLPPVSGVPVRSAVPGSVARTRRHSSTAAADCAHFHREEVPAGRADRVSTADIWEQAAPATVGFKRVPLETFHNDITDPNREQNLVSLLMTEIAAHQTDASRFLRSADKTKDRQGKRSRCSLWIITIFIYLVQIGAASKLLGNGRSGYDTTALVVTFTEGLGNIYNLTAFDSAVTAAGDAGQPGLFSVFDSLMPVERQFSEATIQSIMMTESSNLQKEQLMRRCHVSLVDTQNSAAATCPYKLNVCNTYKGVLNKIINMFAGGFVICGIVFHELFGMLTMEYPVVMPVPDRDGTQPPRLKHIWVLYMFLAAHLCLVITCVTACMVRVYGMGNDFWSVIESIVAAFLILDIDDKALAYIKSRVLARARGGRRRLVLSKIKKSVNLIKAANLFKPRPLLSTWSMPGQSFPPQATVPARSPGGSASDTRTASPELMCNSVVEVDLNDRPVSHDGLPSVEHQDRISTDLELLSAELGLVGSSRCSLPPLEKEPQLRIAVDCTLWTDQIGSGSSTIDHGDHTLSPVQPLSTSTAENECSGGMAGVADKQPRCCCHGCCDDLPIRRRMCAEQLHRDAESCRQLSRWIHKLLTCNRCSRCSRCRRNALLSLSKRKRGNVTALPALEETYITYYTIGVRGDSRLSLLYLAQLLFASPIMWSCWNACVDVDIDYPWVKRAAFVTTWWMTPATIAMALISVVWEPVLHAASMDSKTFWPALFGVNGRRQLYGAAATSLCIALIWCGTFWASAVYFSAWFAMWV